MGPPGAGHRAKLLNNLVSVGQAALVLHAYAMARKNGLDWQKLFDIMMAGIARSGSLERIMVPALKGDLDGYVFSAANAAKDMGYAADFASAQGSPAGVPAALRDFYADAAAQHGADTLISRLLKAD
jgi:3-hydroxyisobutyrate dehydrogenase-like beta-hydroxyacid dehydrogenase